MRQNSDLSWACRGPGRGSLKMAGPLLDYLEPLPLFVATTELRAICIVCFPAQPPCFTLNCCSAIVMMSHPGLPYLHTLPSITIPPIVLGLLLTPAYSSVLPPSMCVLSGSQLPRFLTMSRAAGGGGCGQVQLLASSCPGHCVP